MKAAVGLVLGLACLLGAPAWAANGCAHQAAVMPAMPVQAPGVGGTGDTAGRPGLGGTGMEAGLDAGGVGGTGIVGLITGFASVCVNGVEVQFDATTPVLQDGQPVPLNSLAVGQLVAIQAVGAGTEFAARRIAVLNTLVGPVDRVQAARGELQVLGQTVLVRTAQAMDAFRPGQWVQVGGYRRANGQIEASFLAAIAPQPRARLTGVLEKNQGADVVISGTAVHLGDARLPAGTGRGTELGVEGSWDGATLHASTLQAEPTRNSLGAVHAVVMEGLVHAVHARTIRLGQHTLQLEHDLQVQGGSLQDVAENQRVRLMGSLDAQHQVHVHRIEIRATAERYGTGERRARLAGVGRDASGADDKSGSSDSSGRSGGSDDSGSNLSGSTSGSSGGSGSSGSSGGSGSKGGSSGGGGSGGGGGGGGSGSGKGK